MAPAGGCGVTLIMAVEVIRNSVARSLTCLTLAVTSCVLSVFSRSASDLQTRTQR